VRTKGLLPVVSTSRTTRTLDEKFRLLPVVSTSRTTRTPDEKFTKVLPLDM